MLLLLKLYAVRCSKMHSDMPKSEIKVLLILRHPRIRDIFKSYVCPTQKEQTYVYGKEVVLVEVGHVSIVD